MVFFLIPGSKNLLRGRSVEIRPDRILLYSAFTRYEAEITVHETRLIISKMRAMHYIIESSFNFLTFAERR